MNIINVFKNTVTSLLSESEQRVSEKFIELATFFYKIDRRVSLEEQKYIDELMDTIEWTSSISIESYQRDCIAKLNAIIGNSEDLVFSYLSNLMTELSELGALDKAKSLAKGISDADGEIADDEVKYLELVMACE